MDVQALKFVCIVVLLCGFADIEISDNVCDDNAEGIRLSMGSSYNKIYDNVVTETAGSEPLFSIVVLVHGRRGCSLLSAEELLLQLLRRWCCCQ